MYQPLSRKLCKLGHHGSTKTLIQRKPEFSLEAQRLHISGLFTIYPEVLKSQSFLSIYHLCIVYLNSGGEWNSGGHCREANKLLNQTFKPSYSGKNIIVEEVLKEMKTPVTLLNVSGLSQYRIDAHPSIFGTKPENRRSKAMQDCSHWCLPGVPDTWNHFLYLHLLHKR